MLDAILLKKRRYFRREGVHKEICATPAVEVYNKYMGEDDLLDSILGLHRVQIRSKKWYKNA